MSSNNVLFQDEFVVDDVDPGDLEGKFEKVNRLMCKGVVYELEFLLDINCEIFDVGKDDKLSVAIATSLSLDGSDGGDWQRTDGPSLMDQYDYVMHGVVYKFAHVQGTKVEVHISHGGLLARFVGDQRHLQKLKVDSEVFTLIRKTK